MSEYAAKAALLASSNHKNVEVYQPQSSASARSAAAHARPRTVQGHVHHTPADLSTASSKAALLAHSRQSQPKSANAPSITAQKLDPNTSGPDKALLAATKSFRDQKIPEPAPLSTPKTAREANVAQKRHEARKQESLSRQPGQTSSIVKMAPEMLTEHPPLRMQRDEKSHQAALHASAVSLAKQAYSTQQANSRSSTAPNSLIAATAATAPRSQAEVSGSRQTPLQYSNLQETAQRMANERLAKIRDANEHHEYRDYYGYPQMQRSKSQRIVSKVRGNRRRSGSDPEDVAQSQRIKSQMSTLQEQIKKVDNSQQGQDRQRLLEAARKKVNANMHRMDEDVYRETGKMSPAMMQDWDEKARSRLREKQELPEAKPDDAVDIGGGKRLDRSEIDTLAVSRVKPTLEGINEAVAKKRAEDEEARIREETRKREAREEKELKKEEKAEKKRIHDEEKEVKRHAHDEEKAEKKRIHDEEKAEKKRIHDEKKAEKLARKEETKSKKAGKTAVVVPGTQSQSTRTDSESQVYSTPKQSVESTNPANDENLDQQSVSTAPTTSNNKRHSSVLSRLNRHSVVAASSDQPTTNGSTVDTTATASNLDAIQEANGSKKQPIWKRWSLSRTKSPESNDDSPGRLKAIKRLGHKSSNDDEDTSDKRRSFQVVHPAADNHLTKELPDGGSSIRESEEARVEKSSISAPVADSLRVPTPVPSGSDVLREQENRSDRLAGLHVDSKFHEQIK